MYNLKHSLREHMTSAIEKRNDKRAVDVAVPEITPESRPVTIPSTPSKVSMDLRCIPSAASIGGSHCQVTRAGIWTAVRTLKLYFLPATVRSEVQYGPKVDKTGLLH